MVQLDERAYSPTLADQPCTLEKSVSVAGYHLFNADSHLLLVRAQVPQRSWHFNCTGGVLVFTFRFRNGLAPA